ncbi:type II toxin-antitoxin system VapC family toxin [Caulobacter sp. CCG-8]|uniref:type II toxin-antitoxin system VapC family toxin n=1 Tax=Caulobacter sp. CCG-8 TaxID=3127958 RepID=UPI00307E61E1
MVIDTSAIIAIIAGEPVAPALVGRISEATTRELSVASYVEAATVLWGRDIPPEELDDLLGLLDVTLVPVDEAQGRAAIRARIAYGKGTGHSAQLNFGDTFTYALAKTRGAPLLFVGDDFAHTDLIDARA